AQRDSNLVLDRIYCLQRGSEVAREAGEMNLAVSRVQSAQQQLEHSPLRPEVLQTSLMVTLANAYTAAGRLREATFIYQQVDKHITRLGRENTQSAGTLFSDWGLALSLLGRPVEAVSVLRRAISISQDERGEASVSPVVLINYARALRDAGSYEEASQVAERAHKLAIQLGLDSTVNHALLTRARNYLAQAETDQAERMLDEAEARLRQVLPEGHYGFAAVLSQRSMVAEQRGDLAGALQLAEEAIAIAQAATASGQSGASNLVIYLTRRSELRRQLGQFEPAVEDASRALQLLMEGIPENTWSIGLGRAYLALAQALGAHGDREGERENLELALANFQDAAGPQHPETLQVKTYLEAVKITH
ncbi:MAG TPA: tetratricopeptide repeat protein, partial [Xanthomonadales bacterium]|nr:tetratricopeptide repeat protein [Xanthomonadales bacterium]